MTGSSASGRRSSKGPSEHVSVAVIGVFRVLGVFGVYADPELFSSAERDDES